jgi:hypothetical protein
MQNYDSGDFSSVSNYCLLLACGLWISYRNDVHTRFATILRVRQWGNWLADVPAVRHAVYRLLM